MSLHASHKAKLYNTVYYNITEEDYGLTHSILIKNAVPGLYIRKGLA